ncbi:MAG TPA: lysophospholipase [Candidatus Sulfotelmatobacter sp.]|nr:lysophospholipase [Candidatus Sulfotelmatobacter sp.]
MRRALSIVLLLLAAACTPALQTPGDDPQQPKLTADALITRDGVRLPLRIWPASTPEKAVIVALHGFNDYSNAWAMPAAWWAEHGITTYAYDQRGFGAGPQVGIWAGVEPMVHDAEDAVRLVHARHPHVPVFLVGESMGASVAMVALADPTAPRVAGAVLGGPAVWGRSTMSPLYRAVLWFGVHIMPWDPVTGSNLGIWPSDNIAMLRALGRDPLILKRNRVDMVGGLVDLMDASLAAAPEIRAPTLVLYGQKDELIPRRSVEAMVEKLRDPHRIVVYRNGWHMVFRDLQCEVVWRDVLSWMLTPDAPLPSGEEHDRLPLFTADK